MPRQANAIDFWRGFALVSIFINHIPGIHFDRYTHRNWSISELPICSSFLPAGCFASRSGGRKTRRRSGG